MRSTRLVAATLCLFVPVLAVPVAAAPAAAHIGLGRSVGPPTIRVRLVGSGFGASETVDIGFDGAGLRRVTTDAAGTFRARINVPASARPGPHAVEAAGETSGREDRAPFLVRTDWSKFHFDKWSTGYNRVENVLNRSNVGRLTKRWAFDTIGSMRGTPTVSGGVVYVAQIGRLSALDASTGHELWHASTDDIYECSPAVGPHAVYVTSLEGSVQALRTSDGTPLWTFPTRAFTSPPSLVDGVVYAGDSSLYALDAATGAMRWKFMTGGEILAPVSVSDGVVYLGSGDHRLYALDARTGSKIWSFETGDRVFAAPAVNGGVVYAASTDHNLYALNASTGAELWSFPTGDEIEWSSPAVANGIVYVGSRDHAVHAVDAATGTELWSFETGDEVFSSPAVAGGVVFVGSDDDNIYALDAVTGQELWSYRTGSLGFAPPAVADGRLYVNSYDGNTYAFALRPPQAGGRTPGSR